MREHESGLTRLIIAIGNTHVRYGFCRGGEISDTGAIDTNRVRNDRNASAVMIESPRTRECQRVVIASVVPDVLKKLRAALVDHLRLPIVVVGDEAPVPIALDVDSPEQVGVDRACAAAAAYASARQACVVVDFGTAITINAVSDDGKFIGGVILPGVGLGLRALHEHTAALPAIQLATPSTPVGKNTECAMQSGAYYGSRGAVREVVERIAEGFGKWPYLIFTGGDALWIGENCDFVDAVVPHLGLLGIDLADRMHLEAMDS